MPLAQLRQDTGLRRIAGVGDPEGDDPGHGRGHGRDRGHGASAMARGVADGVPRDERQSPAEARQGRDDHRDQQDHAEHGYDRGRGDGTRWRSPGLVAPLSAEPAMPRPTSTRPRSGERRLCLGHRHPASTPRHPDARRSRPARRCQEARPAARTPTRTGNAGRHLERAEPASRTAGPGAAAPSQRPCPRPTPSAAATPPITIAAGAETAGPDGVPPLAAIRARVRDCRRAPTANAGPARRPTSRMAITTMRTTTTEGGVKSGSLRDLVGPRGAGRRVPDDRAREHERPIPLRARSAQVTGPPPTSQVEPLAVATPRESTRRRRRDSSGSSRTRRCRRPLIVGPSSEVQFLARPKPLGRELGVDDDLAVGRRERP